MLLLFVVVDYNTVSHHCWSSLIQRDTQNAWKSRDLHIPQPSLDIALLNNTSGNYRMKMHLKTVWSNKLSSGAILSCQLNMNHIGLKTSRRGGNNIIESKKTAGRGAYKDLGLNERPLQGSS